MAQSERFYFWRGYYDAMRKLKTDEQRGRLVLSICAYAFDGIEPNLSDDPMLDLAWSLVADGTRESVRKGIEQSQRGRMGGRPTNKKSTAFNGAISGAKSGAKSEKKRREGKGKELSPPTGEREGAAAPPDGAPRASRVEPDGTIVTPSGERLPPKPDGWE